MIWGHTLPWEQTATVSGCTDGQKQSDGYWCHSHACADLANVQCHEVTKASSAKYEDVAELFLPTPPVWRILLVWTVSDVVLWLDDWLHENLISRLTACLTHCLPTCLPDSLYPGLSWSFSYPSQDTVICVMPCMYKDPLLMGRMH